jgi:hypothetical protein
MFYVYEFVILSIKILFSIISMIIFIIFIIIIIIVIVIVIIVIYHYLNKLESGMFVKPK